MNIFHNNYRVVWFDQWNGALDEALQCLPEMDACPHELYRLLVQNPGPSRKRIALVMLKDDVAAVVGLRWLWQRWDPVTKWVVPGTPFPVRDGCFFKILEVLGVESKVALWRCDDLLQQAARQRIVRAFNRSHTHKLDLSGPVENYWKESGSFYRNVLKSRNKCRSFDFECNSPGAAEWTIRNWEAKWRVDSSDGFADLSDRIVAANYMERQGKYFTFSILDKGIPVAGFSSLSHGSDLVCQYNYRRPEYDKAGVGVYIFDRVACWACENGFEAMDIGGGQDYKARWAPPAGEKMEIDICPEWNYRIKQAAGLVRGVKSKAANLMKNLIQ